MKDRGLILILTGDGKGKSSSAFGMIVRSLGWGRKVLLVQFMKGLMETGEGNYFDKIAGDNLKIIRAPCPFTWKTQDKDKDVSLCHKVWNEVIELIAEEHFDMVILDELMITLQYGYMELGYVIDFLKSRPAGMDVIMTGRNAPHQLIDMADTVTELKPLKHAFEKGITAKKGIDF